MLKGYRVREMPAHNFIKKLYLVYQSDGKSTQDIRLITDALREKSMYMLSTIEIEANKKENQIKKIIRNKCKSCFCKDIDSICIIQNFVINEEPYKISDGNYLHFDSFTDFYSWVGGL